MSRRLGRGGGTSLPGKLYLAMRPQGLRDLARPLRDGSACISATNGKTTTARMIVGCADASGRSVVTNTAGANLARGVASTLLEYDGEQLGLFEVDEAALPGVAAALQPRAVVLMNLFRDQLDRYGELEVLADRWATMVSGLPRQTRLVINADDPTLASLPTGDRPVTWFGIEDTAHALEQLPHAADAVRCRSCGSPLAYDPPLLGHLGHWRCSRCDNARPTPAVAATSVTLNGTRGQHITVMTPEGPVEANLGLPGLHNAYNATAAVACARALSVPAASIVAGLEGVRPAFGRAERVRIDGRELMILLAKNPAGVNQNVRTLLLEPDPLHLLISLNDRTADGHDVSWIWDVDYEPLLAHAARITLSGERAYDLALRFRYAGAPEELLHVEPHPARGLNHAMGEAPKGGTVFALPTYTAMLDLREHLVKRGVAAEFWRDG